MTDDIVVVREAEAKGDAYSRGYDRFAGMDADLAADADPAYFSDSAAWANHVLPTLRCMSGYRDDGYGTWQVDGEIALVENGDEDDEPAEAVTMLASDLQSEVVDAWYEGAYAAIDDAIDGRGTRP